MAVEDPFLFLLFDCFQLRFSCSITDATSLKAIPKREYDRTSFFSRILSHLRNVVFVNGNFIWPSQDTGIGHNVYIPSYAFTVKSYSNPYFQEK